MTNVTKYFIGLFTDYFCAIYIFTILSKFKLTKTRVIYFTISALVIPAISTFLRISYNPFYGIIFYAISIVSVFALDYKEYKTAIPTMSIALGIQYVAEIISIIFLVTVFFLFNYFKTNIFTEICTSVLQFTIVFFIMKIKRLKNGLNFLQDKNNFGIGLLISGLVVILTCLQKETMSDYFLSIISIVIAISAICLIVWLRSAITRHYRKRLKLRAEEYSKQELAERNKEIEKLIEENTALSSIIHLDNYIIGTLEASLNDLQRDFDNSKSINDLRILTKQRNEYVNNIIISGKLLPTTGNSDIDAVFSDLYIKAASRGIDFTLNVDCDINYLIHSIIEQADFEELIKVCITNSIVDIENKLDAPGRILIKISQTNDIYELVIMDNGISKDGKSKLISDITEKSNAGVKTNEFDSRDSFTESLTIRFDGLNKKSINNTKLR